MAHSARTPLGVQRCQSTVWAYASSTEPNVGRDPAPEGVGAGGIVAGTGVEDAGGDVAGDEGVGVGAAGSPEGDARDVVGCPSGVPVGVECDVWEGCTTVIEMHP